MSFIIFVYSLKTTVRLKYPIQINFCTTLHGTIEYLFKYIYYKRINGRKSILTKYILGIIWCDVFETHIFSHRQYYDI